MKIERKAGFKCFVCILVDLRKQNSLPLHRNGRVGNLTYGKMLFSYGTCRRGGKSCQSVEETEDWLIQQPFSLCSS